MVVIVRNVAEQRGGTAARSVAAVAVCRQESRLRTASNFVALLAVWMMAMVVASPRVMAASYTWTGNGGDGVWSTGSNWSPAFNNVQPLELFFTAAAGSTSVNDLTTGTTLQSLTFAATSGASFLDNTDNFDPGLNALSVVSGGVVRNLSADDQQIRFRLNVDNNLEMNVAGAGRLIIDNVGGAADITKTGTGTLRFTGAYGFGPPNSNYTGDLYLQAGLTIIDPEGHFPDSAVNVGPNATLMCNAVVASVVSSGVLQPGTDAGASGDPLRYGLTTSSLTLQSTSQAQFTIANHGVSPIGEQQNYVELASTSGTATVAYGGAVGIAFENANTYGIGTTWDLIKTDATTVADRTGILSSVATTGVGPYAGLSFHLHSAGTGSGDAVWRSGWAGSTDTVLEFREASGQLVVVPEPSTMVFAGMGAALSGWSMWRRRRAMRRAAAAAGRGAIAA